MDKPASTQPQQFFNKSGEPLPDSGLKWGRTPAKKNDTVNDDNNDDTSSTTALTQTADIKPDWENFYSEEEKKKLREKGINPALKAEMEASKRNSEAKGIWGKLAQTATGGGWIK